MCPNGGPFMACARCVTGEGHFKLGSPEFRERQRAIYAAGVGLTVEQLAAQVRAKQNLRDRDAAHRRRVRMRANKRVQPRFIVRHMEQERRRGTCFYCGAVADPGEFDHVIPLSRGGSHAPGNLVLACVACNNEKGAMLVIEWRAARVRNNSALTGGGVVALGTPSTVVALVAEAVSRSAA
jgi:5-methylcytosine-specific restriction endonuclease McrA